MWEDPGRRFLLLRMGFLQLKTVFGKHVGAEPLNLPYTCFSSYVTVLVMEQTVLGRRNKSKRHTYCTSITRSPSCSGLNQHNFLHVHVFYNQSSTDETHD